MQPNELFVRTLQAPDHLTFDERLGLWRLSSKAFGPSGSDKTVSGDLGQLLKEDKFDVLALYPAVVRAAGAVGLPIAAVREAGCGVEHLPLPTDWYHAGITGVSTSGKKRRLHGASQELVPIDQAEAQRIYDEQLAAARREQQGGLG